MPPEAPPNETPPAKPELKSFEDAAAEFMKQAAANEYPSDDGDEVAPAPAPEVKKEETKAPEKKEPEKAATSRRAPDALFKKEEAKADETKAEPTKSTFDSIVDPNFKDPARSEQWKTVKAMGMEWETKYHALEKQLAEVQASSKPSADFEKAIAERDARIKEMQEREERANWDNSENGGVKYRNARAAVVDQAKRLIADNDGDANAVETALNLKGKARIEALRAVAEELPGFQQGLLGQMIRELDVLDTEAAAKRDESSKSWKELQQQEQERYKQEQEAYTARMLKAYDGVKRDMERELEVLRVVDGVDWWNDKREEILSKSDKFYRENEDPREAGKAAIWKEAGPVYRDLYMEERKHSESVEKELADAKKALEEAYGSTPRAAGATGDGPAKTVKNMSFEERVAYEGSREH